MPAITGGNTDGFGGRGIEGAISNSDREGGAGVEGEGGDTKV